jgi:hypothetical protein
MFAADSATQGDPITMLAQLGIGGVLVGFAVWLQNKFTTEKNAAIKAKEAELAAERINADAAIAAQRVELTAEIVAERLAHDKTREVVIELLKQQIKDQERNDR